MKENIHPEFYPEATVTCSCGNSWVVGSTVPEIRTDVCSNCHPFFTGEQRIVDTAGRVERFLRKLERRDQAIAEAEARKALAKSPELSISELDISSRAAAVLDGAGIKSAGDVIARLEDGDEALTNLKGFGLKSLATLKKVMRARGFVLPGDAVAVEKEAITSEGGG
jgi:large subunit ribosomal protein L31